MFHGGWIWDWKLGTALERGLRDVRARGSAEGGEEEGGGGVGVALEQGRDWEGTRGGTGGAERGSGLGAGGAGGVHRRPWHPLCAAISAWKENCPCWG